MNALLGLGDYGEDEDDDNNGGINKLVGYYNSDEELPEENPTKISKDEVKEIPSNDAAPLVGNVVIDQDTHDDQTQTISLDDRIPPFLGGEVDEEVQLEIKADLEQYVFKMSNIIIYHESNFDKIFRGFKFSAHLKQQVDI